MRTIFLFLLLSLPLMAQINGVQHGQGTIRSDSVYFGAGTATVDSVKIYDFRFANYWYSIVFEGNANSPVDSVIITKGTLRFNDAGVLQDTVWGNQINWKDSTWTDVNTLINNTVGVHYTAFEPVVNLLKIEFLNAWANLNTRKLKYVLNYK